MNILDQVQQGVTTTFFPKGEPPQPQKKHLSVPPSSIE